MLCLQRVSELPLLYSLTTMMEGAGSVASIRRPINANAVPPRSYTDYQYQYGTRTTPTATSATSTAATPTSSGAAAPRRCRCCRTCCSAPTASTLGNLGVCGLVLGYTVLGAFTFMALESGGGSEGTRALHGSSAAVARHDRVDKLVNDIRSRTVERLWSITEDLNILYKDNWTRLASQEVLKFQDSLVHTLRSSSYRGGSGGGSAGSSQQSQQTHQQQHRWTFSSSFLYSLTLITTIGKHKSSFLL
ncbi:hypothetical protein B566_EDAN007238 [Ephemera danica]|nr:hypothetical protein B566_EDAN007238 [Ephemera danica]